MPQQQIPWWMQYPDQAYVSKADDNSNQNNSIIATPKTKEEFDAIPDGTFYIEPDDGHIYQKGRKTMPNPKHLRTILT